MKIFCFLITFLSLSSFGIMKINSSFPAGGQAGTECHLSIYGSGLDKFIDILFYEAGVDLVEVVEKTDKKLKLKLKIIKNADLGPRLYRLLNEDGLSDVRIFSISQFPNYFEIEKIKAKEKIFNNDRKTAELVKKNSTICGSILNGDLDYYGIELEKGERLSCEIEAMRLANRFFDPHLSLFDEQGTELVANDDNTLLRQDSYLEYVAPSQGKYFLLVRDSEYAGNYAANYRLHVGDFPRPVMSYPAVIKNDEVTKLQYILASQEKVTQQLDAVKLLGKQQISFKQGGQASPSPIHILSNKNKSVLELEPNNEKKQATKFESMPINLNGVIEKKGDVDWWAVKLEAKKDYVFKLEARSLRSPLDGVLEIYNEKGKVLKKQDDTRGFDPKITLKSNEAGWYYIRIFDHLRRGALNFVYALTIELKAPTLALNLPPKRDRTQEGQTINLIQGSRMLCLLSVNRDGASGKEQIQFKNLPKGVTAKLIKVPDGLGQLPILFEAKADAKVAPYFIEPRISNDKKIQGSFGQRVSLVNGGNNKVFEHHDLSKLALGLLPKAPYSFQVESLTKSLPRYGNRNLLIKLKRDEGFDAEVHIKLAYKSKGFTGLDQVKIPKGKNEVSYNVSIGGDAALGKWPIVFFANTNHNKLVYSMASEPHFIDVSEQFFSVKSGQCTVKRSQKRDLTVTLQHLRAFDKQAKAELKGLPQGIVVKELSIDKATQELKFELEVGAKVRPGTYKDLYVSFDFEADKVQLNQNIRTGGIFRVSAPKKVKK